MIVDCIVLTLATVLEEVDVMAKDLPRISAISLSGLLIICWIQLLACLVASALPLIRIVRSVC